MAIVFEALLPWHWPPADTDSCVQYPLARLATRQNDHVLGEARMACLWRRRLRSPNRPDAGDPADRGLPSAISSVGRFPGFVSEGISDGAWVGCVGQGSECVQTPKDADNDGGKMC